MPVFVQGWGTTCAMGVGVDAAVQGLREGRRPIRPARFSPHLAPVPGDPLPVAEVPITDDDPYRRPRIIVDTAVDEAVERSGGLEGRVGVFAGTTGGFFSDAEIKLMLARRDDPTAWPAYTQRGPGELAAHVTERLGADGPMATFTTACTSSGIAFAAAARHLRAGTCDTAVVVGFDLLSSFILHGFRGLLLIDGHLTRPFDRSRAGLQLGEGAGVLVLSRRPSRWRVLGSANVLDSGHVTSSATDGSTAEQVMRRAIRASGLTTADVATIKAHGTGTGDNDLAEGRGLFRVFGEQAPPFASLKGMLGHTLGASSSLETALWLACLEQGFLPASAGFTDVDPDIGLAPITRERQAVRGAHLFNAFGFGGSCACQVVSDA